MSLFKTRGHGISVFPQFALNSPKIKLTDLSVSAASGAGMHFIQSDIFVVNDVVMGNLKGRIVCVQSTGLIQNCQISWNFRAGISWDRLLTPFGKAQIMDNTIQNTFPELSTGLWGDGIDLFLIEFAKLDNNLIQVSSRAGLANFASFASLEGNVIQCAAFELVSCF